MGVVIEEQVLIVRADLLCHLLNRAGHAVVLAQLQQIAEVACPAAEISRRLIAGMISHVHAAEHV